MPLEGNRLVRKFAIFFKIDNRTNRRDFAIKSIILALFFLFFGIVLPLSGIFEWSWLSALNDHLVEISIFSALSLNVAILFWSVGMNYSQREQSVQIEKLTAARQRFDQSVSEQFKMLRNHFADIKSDGDHLHLEVYVSSPAFGIVGGAAGLSYYASIIEEFAAKAIRRAQNNKPSVMDIYFWDKDQHKKKLGRNAQEPLWFWKSENSEQLDRIGAEVCRICSQFEQMKNYAKNIFIRQHVIEADELRFVVLNEGNGRSRAAVIAMSPIRGQSKDHLHSILLLDDTSGGVREMDKYFKSFAEHHNTVQRSECEIANDPFGVFEAYFDYDFRTNKTP